MKQRINLLVPGRGLEPPWDCSHQLLRLARLPFRHPGKTRLLVYQEPHVEDVLYLRR